MSVTRRAIVPFRRLGLALVMCLCALPLRADDDAEAVVRLLRAVVGVQADIPRDARTAEALGVRREGSGVVIDDNGLIVTIGYVVLEAERVEIRVGDETLPADVVAYDHDSGFGLVRARQPLPVEPMPLGDSADVAAGEAVLVVSWQDGHQVTPARVASRRPFAGYWEYLLADAIFTVPPHPLYGGAALVSADGRLAGIGSLFVGDAIGENRRSPGNMFVPIDALTPILADLIAEGRRSSPPAPWLGLFARDIDGRIFVTRVADGGPAEAAGLQPGDVIIGVDGSHVSGLTEFYQSIRALGVAGADIPLDVVRRGTPDLTIERVAVHSADRSAWLKLQRD